MDDSCHCGYRLHACLCHCRGSAPDPQTDRRASRLESKHFSRTCSGAVSADKCLMTYELQPSAGILHHRSAAVHLVQGQQCPRRMADVYKSCGRPARNAVCPCARAAAGGLLPELPALSSIAVAGSYKSDLQDERNPYKTFCSRRL